MLRSNLLILWGVVLWVGAGLAVTRARGQSLESARIGADGRVYLRWSGQAEQMQRPGEAQTGISDLRVAPNRQVAAWVVERTDISDANYPESVELMVASVGGRLHGLFPGRFLGSWVFEDGGRRLAVYDSTAHGNTAGAASLYSTRTGRRLALWQTYSKPAPPRWAAPLRAEWDSDNP